MMVALEGLNCSVKMTLECAIHQALPGATQVDWGDNCGGVRPVRDPKRSFSG
jgi:hypothetical protein